MEYNQCYNMDKSYRIILKKNSKFQKTTYDMMLFFLVLKSEYNKLKLTYICGKTSFRRKAIKTGTVIISGRG